MKKILITENREIAEKHIRTLKENARAATALIAAFNSLPVLNPIKSRERVTDFFDSPVEFLNNAVLKDSGVTFSTKAKPLPEKIAEIFAIPYDQFVKQIYKTRLNGFENMRFDEKTLTVEFDEDCKTAIYDSFKEFATSEAEVKEITRIRALCKNLNEYCDRWDIDAPDMHTVAERLHLKIVTIQGAKQFDSDIAKYKFIENIAAIRRKLDYEKGMEGLNNEL